MFPVDTLMHQARPMTSVGGLEVELFATEAGAASAFAALPSYVEQQAAAFAAESGKEQHA